MKLYAIAILTVALFMSVSQAVARIGSDRPRAYPDRFDITHPHGKEIPAKPVHPWKRGNRQRGYKTVALMFVGHGEPAYVADGDIPVAFPDGSEFGPHGVELGVPLEFQHTEWAAAYEEIATAMAYIFWDINGNGIPHEVMMVPHGDVPDFFSWEAFHGTIYQQYADAGGYSPHNDTVRAHVDSVEIDLQRVKVDVYLALLDDVPRIPDVVYEISQKSYDELVVVPMLVANSTHTDEITGQMEEVEHLTHGMDVLVTEPFFEVPYMKKSLAEGIVSMTHYLARHVPEEVEEHNIGVLLAAHGTPYVPPYPEFGWTEGEIYSELMPTEDAFHEWIATMLPWSSKTGRMNYAPPEIEDSLIEFEEEGFTHVVVVPSAFPTTAIHTLYHVAEGAVGRPVLTEEGVVEHERLSGMKVYYTSLGFADLPHGQMAFRKGLNFLGKIAVMEALDKSPPTTYDASYHCPPQELCVVLDTDVPITTDLKFLLYETSDVDWPDAFEGMPMPDWMVTIPPPVPDKYPARLRIPLEGNLTPLTGKDITNKQVGLAVLASDTMMAGPTDPRGFSTLTAVETAETGLDFGRVELAVPDVTVDCQAGEICVTVHADAVTGPEFSLMLYITTEEDWPQAYLSLPTPSAVIQQTFPVPDTFPVDIHIPLEGNLYTFSGQDVIGQRLGLAVVTGVSSNFVIEPTDARAFSENTLIYLPGEMMDYGSVDLYIPEGNPSDLNPYHPHRLTGSLLWEEHMLGPDGFVPGAIYLDVHDLDGDGVKDIIMVGEPHFEEPELPLTVLKLGVYYMNPDMTVKSMEILDSWSESDPLFYSPWGINVVDHAGRPMIIIGCNIPELAPLEDGYGQILSYHKEGDLWVRSIVRHNPDPTVTNYNAMIVVTEDIDQDGDEDLALSGAFQTSSIGSWMENTGDPLNPWIEHLQPMDPGTDPAIRGTLAYKSADLNGDLYPEILYNAMFDVPGSNPPVYRGEIWLAINPGPGNLDDPWEMVVIDPDNWASADMWIHDFDNDGFADLIANQIFNSTVTRYWNPAGNLTDTWNQEVIINDLTSPSDMWLEDINLDGHVDVCSADHTAHRGFWHENPGPGNPPPWKPNLIFRNIRLPGDFAMEDMDADGDVDWVGTSMTWGKAFIVEQVHPPESLVVTASLPDGFNGNISRFMVTLASSLPVMGPPAAVLADISNDDSDGDGIPDVDNILSGDKDLTLAFKDAGLTGDYHVMVVLYMEGGGVFQPVPGVDYMAASGKLTLGSGQATTELELQLVPTF